MEIDIVRTIELILMGIGVATAALNIVAPLTKSKKDDKVLNFLKKFLEIVSLNVDEKGQNKLIIQLKNKK